ncbi:50S ribosomal protein bL37 [Streptomyces sp. NPDC127108]
MQSAPFHPERSAAMSSKRRRKKKARRKHAANHGKRPQS